MSSKKNDKKPAEENPDINAEEIQEKTPVESVSEPAAEKEPKADVNKPSPEDELKAEKDKYIRLLAEYDNYRKRSVKERGSICADVRSDTVMKFLPVYDNLVRALEQSTEDEAYRKGVEMIMAQFKEIIAELGVTEIATLGHKFDPTLHEAVIHEGDDTKGEGEIVQEFRKGFKLGDKVIRFAMVKVAN
jgi:molecular chaperone GrpE